MKDLEPELSEYLELPVLDQAGATALAAALMASVPARMPAEVRRAAQEMGAAAQAKRDAWDEEPVPNLHDRRPADPAVDRAWAALHGRLLGYAGLPPERYPEAFEAGRLARALFPGGRWPWGAPLSQQWAESAERLALIAERGLEPRLVALAGPPFLAEVRRACQACAQAHGVDRLTLRLRAPGRPDKLEALLRVMRRYVIQVLAQLDDDPERQAWVRRALRPLDELRAEAWHRVRAPAAPAEDPPAAPRPAPHAQARGPPAGA